MITLQLTILFILLLLSAIFSGSETSFFSISEIERRRLLLSKSKRRRLAGKLLSKPGKLLVTILTGNMVVNIGLSTINAELFEHYLGDNLLSVILEIYVTTFLLLLFGEVTPKTVAVQRTESFASMSSIIIKIVSVIVFPLRIILEQISKIFLPSNENRTVDEAEMKSAIEASSESGFISKKISILSDIVLGLDQILLSDFAISISDIMLCDDSERDNLVDYFKKGYKAIVFYKDNENNVSGVYTLNDYLSGDYDGTFFVLPDNTTALKGLSTLIENSVDDLLLVDERGRITGVVPDEELLSELFTGTLKSKNQYFKTIGDSTIVEGNMGLKVINKHFGTRLKSRMAKSIGGYICEKNGNILQSGEVIEVDDLVIRIIKSSEKSIDLLSIKIKQGQ